ncbi:MAG: Tim44-like domain-containing protein [Methylomonas sp.]|jgi:predicted lipid-binding transport protein (Tim44 family)
MKKKTHICLSLLIAMALLFAGIHEAEAKRFGGGGSFGSKPSYSQPFQGSASPNSFAQPLRSPVQQQAAAQNQAARQGLSNRGGLMGMLGGLALGGLLGSLFFGGAFEHINFMDMLLFAGLAYLLYRLFTAGKRQNQPLTSGYARNSYADASSSFEQQPSSARGFDTDILSKGRNSTPVNPPAGFDQQSFLVGAERAYRHLQEAWDQHDLASIRGLTTDKVFAEIQDQMRASAANNKTEVLKVQPELLEIREAGSDLEATVLFDALLRENGAEAEQVKEVWHFIKPINSQQPKWFLDGIQQLN